MVDIKKGLKRYFPCRWNRIIDNPLQVVPMAEYCKKYSPISEKREKVNLWNLE
jgi:hypothetical protein